MSEFRKLICDACHAEITDNKNRIAVRCMPLSVRTAPWRAAQWDALAAERDACSWRCAARIAGSEARRAAGGWKADEDPDLLGTPSDAPCVPLSLPVSHRFHADPALAHAMLRDMARLGAARAEGSAEHDMRRRAEKIAEALLANDKTPPWLKRPEMSASIQAWARAEALAAAAAEYLIGPAPDEPEGDGKADTPQ